MARYARPFQERFPRSRVRSCTHGSSPRSIRGSAGRTRSPSCFRTPPSVRPTPGTCNSRRRSSSGPAARWAPGSRPQSRSGRPPRYSRTKRRPTSLAGRHDTGPRGRLGGPAPATGPCRRGRHRAGIRAASEGGAGGSLAHALSDDHVQRAGVPDRRIAVRCPLPARVEWRSAAVVPDLPRLQDSGSDRAGARGAAQGGGPARRAAAAGRARGRSGERRGRAGASAARGAAGDGAAGAPGAVPRRGALHQRDGHAARRVGRAGGRAAVGSKRSPSDARLSRGAGAAGARAGAVGPGRPAADRTGGRDLQPEGSTAMKRYLIGGALAGVVLIGLVAARRGHRVRAATRPAADSAHTAALGTSDVARPPRSDLIAGVPVSGTLEPALVIRIASPIPEVVEEVLVKEGQAVRQGQALARFRTSAAEPAALSAEAQRRLAASDYERMQSLFKE